MNKDNYLLRSEILQIKTENLTIQIVKNKGILYAICYLVIPDYFEEQDRIQITQNCNLAVCTLRNPLFTICLSKDFTHYLNLFDYYEEARLALLDIIKWKEYWF